MTELVDIEPTPTRRPTRRRIGPLFGLVFGYISTLFQHLFVDQARNGRLRRIDWPRGLRPLVNLALAAYFVAVAMILGSGYLRSHLPLVAIPGGRTIALPEAPLWLVLFLIIFSLALMQTAALHAAAWLRVVGLGFSILVIVYTTSFFAAGGDPDSSTNVLMIALSAVLVVFTAIRWRRSFAWWEFPIVLVVITVGMTVPLAISQDSASLLGYDLLPVALSLIFQVLGQLAVPLSMAAGVSAAELAMGAATRTAEYIRERLPASVLGAMFALLAGWRLYTSWNDLAGEDGKSMVLVLRQHLGALIFIALVLGMWVVLDRLAERASGRGSTELFHLMVLKARVALPASAVLTIFLLPIVLLVLGERALLEISPDSGVARWMSDLSDDLSSERAVRILRLVGGAVLVAAGVVLARRGRRGLAESSATIGIVVLAQYATEGAAVFSSIRWTKSSLEHVGLAFIVVLTVWWAITRRLTVRRITALLALVLLAALLPDSDFVSDPVAALLGFAGVGFVLFGFIWRLLSDSGPANESSPQFPREVRVLLLLSYNLFAVTVLGFSALARDPEAGIDLGAFASLGAEFLGTAIVLGAFVSVALSALGDRPLLEQAPPSVDPPSFDEPPPDARAEDEQPLDGQREVDVSTAT